MIPGWEDPLEKGMASHSSILAWRMDRGAWQAIVQRMTKSRAQLKQLSMYFAIDGFPGSSAGKESAYNAGDPSSIPGSGRFTGEGIGYPSCILGLPWWLSW